MTEPPTKLHERSQYAQRFVRDWSELIGQHYANALLPARVTTITGSLLFLVGFLGGTSWISRLAAHATIGVFVAACLACSGPGLIVLIVGIGRTVLLGRKIRRALILSGYGDPGSTPDLSNRSRLLNWAKYNGVPIANIGLAIKGVRQERLGP